MREGQKVGERQKRGEGFFALSVAPLCSLAARRHLTLTLFVPATPKVNDFMHYCKWCLVFTLSRRRNEYSSLLLRCGCPEVELYVKVCPKTDSQQSSEGDNDIANASVMIVRAKLPCQYADGVCVRL